MSTDDEFLASLQTGKYHCQRYTLADLSNGADIAGLYTIVQLQSDMDNPPLGQTLRLFPATINSLSNTAAMERPDNVSAHICVTFGRPYGTFFSFKKQDGSTDGPWVYNGQSDTSASQSVPWQTAQGKLVRVDILGNVMGSYVGVISKCPAIIPGKTQTDLDIFSKKSA